MKLISLIAIILLSLPAFSGTCTNTSRSNYSAYQVLTASALNADLNQLVTKVNGLDGGCVTDNTLEAGSLNTTDFAVLLNGVVQGCLVSYSDSNTLLIGRCFAAVNGSFVRTTVSTSATWGCSGCSAEAPATVYYLYIKTGSTGSTLTPLISTVAPNADGYDNSGNRALAKFYNDGSSNIDRNYMFMWDTYAFQDEVNPIPAGTVWATSAASCSTGWLLANGDAKSRTTYARLFAAIGETHGEGDNVSTFNIPDYRGRFLRGVDGGAARDPDRASRTAMNTNGNTGDNVGSVQTDSNLQHAHLMFNDGTGSPTDNLTPSNYVAKDPNGNTNYNSYTMTSHAGTAPGYGLTGDSGGGESRPENANVTYCVKY